MSHILCYNSVFPLNAVNYTSEYTGRPVSTFVYLSWGKWVFGTQLRSAPPSTTKNTVHSQEDHPPTPPNRKEFTDRKKNVSSLPPPFLLFCTLSHTSLRFHIGQKVGNGKIQTLTMNLYVCIKPKILTTFPDADNPQTLALSFFVFNWKLVVDIISEWEWKEPFEILDSKRPFLEMQTTYVNLDPREPLGQPQKSPGTGKRGRFLRDLDQRLHFLTRRTLWV